MTYFVLGIIVEKVYTIGGFSEPIRSLKFWSINENGKKRGNKLAIDDLKIQPVPEPMSLILLGAGLLAFAGIRRKRHI